MAYQTKYNPINKTKYIGTKKIICRSLWERSFAKYCDNNDKIVKWAVEPFSIPYFDAGTKKNRRYFPDFYLEMEDGKKIIVEIKPHTQTKPPTSTRRTKRTFLAEQTYMTNQSKWFACDKFCKEKGWEFKVVTEKTLEAMGITIIKVIRKKKA